MSGTVSFILYLKNENPIQLYSLPNVVQLCIKHRFVTFHCPFHYILGFAEKIMCRAYPKATDSKIEDMQIHMASEMWEVFY